MEQWGWDSGREEGGAIGVEQWGGSGSLKGGSGVRSEVAGGIKNISNN